LTIKNKCNKILPKEIIMIFSKIDLNKWERKEHFLHYDRQSNCSYSITSEIKMNHLIKKIKKIRLNFYKVFIYIVSKAVNSIDNFKIGINKDGCIGYFDKISAAYLLFHENNKTFTCAYTEYEEDFDKFNKIITEDFEKYRKIYGFEAVKIPNNTFNVSCIPWIKYSSLNLNIPINGKYYAPIITWGKYERVFRKIIMPLTVQINHAVADGYHTAKFLNEIQKICNEF
jgi:chloramphenicol O-acetyltransferase type A